MMQQQRLPPPPPITPAVSKKRLLPPPRRTNPLVWCCAIFCAIFSLLLIIAGIATLIVFLAIKPKHPLFEATATNLNAIYLDSVQYLNGDFTLVANLSNPNRKMDLRFDYLDVELYFSGALIATQALQQPSPLRRRESRLLLVHMISSQVYLPLNLSMELRKQVERNRVRYFIKGSFRVRAMLGGLIHFSYWLCGTCHLVITAPPTGLLVARSCTTTRGKR